MQAADAAVYLYGSDDQRRPGQAVTGRQSREGGRLPHQPTLATLLGGNERRHRRVAEVNLAARPPRTSWRNDVSMPRKKTARIARPSGHSVHDVFTPTRPAARLNYVARPALDDRLVDALRTPGKQLIVYGESGSGKSTLLRNKLQEVYEAHIKTQCSAAMSYDQLLLDAFDQLDQYYVHNTSIQSSRSITPSIVADFKAIRVGLNANLAKAAGKLSFPAGILNFESSCGGCDG